MIGQLCFKIEHTLNCSTDLDLGNTCSHAQLYIFLGSFLKNYHNKLDYGWGFCFFFNLWKRTWWKPWPRLHNLLQTFEETWCYIISNSAVLKQNVNLHFARCLLLFIFNQNIWIDIWTYSCPWKEKKNMADKGILSTNINWGILVSLKLAYIKYFKNLILACIPFFMLVYRQYKGANYKETFSSEALLFS